MGRHVYFEQIRVLKEGLLGTDFFERVGAVVDFECATMSLSDIDKVPRTYGVPRAENTALTVFTRGKAESSSQPSQQETWRTEVQPTVGLRPKKDIEQSRTWLVRAKDNITVAPRCRQIVIGRLDSEKEHSIPPLVCVEPAQIPIEGILQARALSRVKSSAHEHSRVKSKSSNETGAPSGCAYIMVANFTSEALTIPKTTVLGIAEEGSESLVDRINTDSDQPTKPQRKMRNEALYQKLLQNKLDH